MTQVNKLQTSNSVQGQFCNKCNEAVQNCECPERQADGSWKEQSWKDSDELNMLVRDLTSVSHMTKSEARRRIQDFTSTQLEKLIDEIPDEKVTNINVKLVADSHAVHIDNREFKQQLRKEWL